VGAAAKRPRSQGGRSTQLVGANQEPQCCRAGSSLGSRSSIIRTFCSLSRAMGPVDGVGGNNRPRPLIYPCRSSIARPGHFSVGRFWPTRSGFDFLGDLYRPHRDDRISVPADRPHHPACQKTQNIVLDRGLIGARYGTSGVAATVAISQSYGMIPYIALQLKAVSSSLEYDRGPARHWAGPVHPMLGDPPLLVAVSLAAFAVLFGTRAYRRHRTSSNGPSMLASPPSSRCQARGVWRSAYSVASDMPRNRTGPRRRGERKRDEQAAGRQHGMHRACPSGERGPRSVSSETTPL